MNKIRVWDLPTRLFHWSLVICVVGAFCCVKFASVTQGWIANLGVYWLSYHVFFGYCALTLILFRLIWGLVGGHYSRFTTFIKGPRYITRYLKGEYHPLGHNPLGALSVIALLGLFGLQAVSGLFVSDDIAYISSGPFAGTSYSKVLSSIHKSTEPLLILLVCVHVLAIIIYRLKNKNLVIPMITGDMLSDRHAAVSQDSTKTRLFALIIFIACIVLVYYISGIKLGGTTSSFDDFM
ncbi:cytochrome b/b6 domain-containing protein [Basilea psittacipulmonis]|uniref:Cytochrome b561 bacterial/Ni-hydrogenase domain-containing protein n=1 Tax=Basilea psittacipulmonis DSM 24701 TaxID=1072685 RepID=A0A077DGZ9_9BURK|nr:cytochrome b/b6 domain-containing protein [Basilea psittacipulmonis]AIL32707.1 hypothetical protein IX83_04750 [Basilea psittacipulmonis DSM 24701]